jgi:hypothetical protein
VCHLPVGLRRSRRAGAGGAGLRALLPCHVWRRRLVPGAMDMPGSAVAGLVRRHRQNDTVTAVAAEDDTRPDCPPMHPRITSS